MSNAYTFKQRVLCSSGAGMYAWTSETNRVDETVNFGVSIKKINRRRGFSLNQTSALVYRQATLLYDRESTGKSW